MDESRFRSVSMKTLSEVPRYVLIQKGTGQFYMVIYLALTYDFVCFSHEGRDW